MRRILLAAVMAGAWLIAPSSDAFAQETGAGTLLKGCKGVITTSTSVPSPLDAIKEGSCFGIVVGISFADEAICPPKGLTYAQAIKVVIEFVEKNPKRHGEDLMTLAQESMRAAYQCKKP